MIQYYVQIYGAGFFLLSIIAFYITYFFGYMFARNYYEVLNNKFSEESILMFLKITCQVSFLVGVITYFIDDFVHKQGKNLNFLEIFLSLFAIYAIIVIVFLVIGVSFMAMEKLIKRCRTYYQQKK